MFFSLLESKKLFKYKMKGMINMITIKQVAKLANVSSSTVSRVLNNGYVSEELRAKVNAVIEETGYSPSEQAKALRTKKTKVIGVILPRLNTEASIRIVDGLNDTLSELNYQILLITSNLNYEKEIEYLRLLESKAVDGIVLIATNVSDDLTKIITELRTPIVAVGQEIPNIPIVIHNDYQAAYDMTTKIINKEHVNIGYLGVDEADRAVGYNRKQGYKAALRDHGININDQLIKTGNFTFESGYELTKEIMSSNIAPTAIFATTDRIATGCIKYLKEQNVLIPEEVAVVGVGNSDLSKYLSPQLTTIEFSYENTGRKVAKILLDKIENKNVKNLITITKFEIIERESL